MIAAGNPGCSMDDNLFDKMEPEDYEFSAILNAVNNDSERSAVMVAAAHLSELLRRLIVAYLIENQGVKGLFSGPTAPLGSFSARCSAAHALGLLLDDEVRQLNLIRRVRNAFAHEARASFRDEQIVSKCFLLDAEYRMPPTDGRNASIIRRQKDGREHFSAHANALIIVMTMRYRSGDLNRLTSPLGAIHNSEEQI